MPLSRIRLTQPGWETYTGDLGVVPFDNGVSCREVTQVEAMRIANNIACETLEGFNPSSSQLMIDTQATPMDAQMLPFLDRSPVAVAEPARVYTETELFEIADRRGIAGLREIGDPLDIKAKSISAMVSLIMEHQAASAGQVVVSHDRQTQGEVVITAQPEVEQKAAE